MEMKPGDAVIRLKPQETNNVRIWKDRAGIPQGPDLTAFPTRLLSSTLGMVVLRSLTPGSNLQV
jgi:hypothetical protein